MNRFLLASTLGILSINSSLATPIFHLNDGDTVALIGDAFIEREQYNGWIEIAATTQFPNHNVKFRNLGWSGDTPTGNSRGGLSPLQAGHEDADEGWRQLQIQLATYQPNVIILGYGMAASLDGTPADDFKTSILRLINSAPEATGNDVRFLILGPPPRFERPTEKPELRSKHQSALAEIEKSLRDTASEINIPFVQLSNLPQIPAFSDNGIHLTNQGYHATARHIEKALGWNVVPWDQGEAATILRQHIITKNDWFFHRSRPANMAYIFGFRKYEQENNAPEIEKFDALVATQEKHIATMRDLEKGTIIAAEPPRTNSTAATITKQAHPEFKIQDGYEISLWAENPLLHKPIHMNFDSQGRLWVATSEVYPQVEPGQTANDKIIVLEDTSGDGKADSSTVFADGLLIPTAVIPGDDGCYVGQSTDLLHFSDTNGDGKGDQKRRILSGFGTEDTHHNLHTFSRGTDGRIWMTQSIYTRTHTETPHGVVRLKSGGIFRFNPHSLKLEPTYFGWINAWGHQTDRFGQSFVTDGAGGGGINWAIPGAMYIAYAGAQRTLDSISPGGYPKFSGLEIIESPHFPDDWQGSMITCDFRAHRVVRFNIADNDSGFTAPEANELLRSNSPTFRPIDAKIGPDGALYIADWSNPIIQHGEVDFRDPRRDRVHGRIWRVTRKNSPLTPVRNLNTLSEQDLLNLLTSNHRHERQQAVTLLFESQSPTLNASIKDWINNANSDRELLAALYLSQSRNQINLPLLKQLLNAQYPPIRAAAIRVLADWTPHIEKNVSLALLSKSIADEHPRVRLESIRALDTLHGHEPIDIALQATAQPMDRFINYALWLNLQNHGNSWLNALLNGTLNAEDRQQALKFTLENTKGPIRDKAAEQFLP